MERALPRAGGAGTLRSMNAMLEVPAIRERAMLFSVEDYHRMTEGQSTELLRGTIIQKMSKSPSHSYISDEVREILAQQIAPPFMVLHERPLTLADSEPEPDVCVVRGKKADFRTRHPTTAELVIEVAVSSLEIDRVKALLYAEAGVQEYWIICPMEKRVETYREPGEKGYGVRVEVEAPGVLACLALPGVSVDLAALFA